MRIHLFVRRHALGAAFAMILGLPAMAHAQTTASAANKPAARVILPAPPPGSQASSKSVSGATTTASSHSAQGGKQGGYNAFDKGGSGAVYTAVPPPPSRVADQNKQSSSIKTASQQHQPGLTVATSRRAERVESGRGQGHGSTTMTTTSRVQQRAPGKPSAGTGHAREARSDRAVVRTHRVAEGRASEHAATRGRGRAAR